MHSTYRPMSLVRQSALTPTTNQPTSPRDTNKIIQSSSNFKYFFKFSWNYLNWTSIFQFWSYKDHYRAHTLMTMFPQECMSGVIKNWLNKMIFLVHCTMKLHELICYVRYMFIVERMSRVFKDILIRQFYVKYFKTGKTTKMNKC